MKKSRLLSAHDLAVLRAVEVQGIYGLRAASLDPRGHAARRLERMGFLNRAEKSVMFLTLSGAAELDKRRTA